MNARERVGVGSVGENPASVPAADKARGRRFEIHTKKPVLGTEIGAERGRIGVRVARIGKVIPA